MKRIQEKVKDIVEVRNYESLQDFITNPEQTLGAYHFTDVTADLMSKWLDGVAGVQLQEGFNFALAGYRGVGKSHFLAALGAIVSQPELRSRIAETHVSASAQTLKRRRYPVAYVKRGIYNTLLTELREAMAQTFEIKITELGASIEELLYFAARRAGDLPFVLLIDTAFERSSRVVRDDGGLLGKIAEIAEKLNIFVGVALDDDIAGADGANSAISAKFKIDYLDQEHLYQIVDHHLFPKHRQMLPVLHEIYHQFRAVLPAFRWSEQRFSALYPLHPMILEVAPFVRLYVQDFALLRFAFEAGGKILGRPANSLIALDEVFDSAESTLRKAEDLTDVFAAYDRLNSEVVSQIPIMQRLQAKLILKALLILSLDGSGTTAEEVTAAMLIFDEGEPERAVVVVREILDRFAAFLPEDIDRSVENGREISYHFKIKGKDNLNKALAQAIQNVSPGVIDKILRRIGKEKFSDWTLAEETETDQPNWMDGQTIWRGGLRRGRIVWELDAEEDSEKNETLSEFADWELIISRRENDLLNNLGEVPKMLWQPAALRPDEIETILKYYVLTTQTELREEFGEQIRAAGHSHTIAVEKIWNRIFLQDAKLVIDNFDYNFTDEARSAKNLSEIFSSMIEPFFEARYPMHPYFARQLGMNEVSILVNDLFSGAHPNLQEVQQIAETFALPLGLVVPRGGFYALESEERLLSLPLAQEVLALVKLDGSNPVSLKNVYRQLKKSPNGLVREAQHLILTALVAQRQIEFVTSKGDRINRRSLDLKIIWDDIVGIAKPVGTTYAEQRLSDWARILTGNQTLPSIDGFNERDQIIKALQNWLTDWESARILDRFAELPDEILNLKVWRLAVHAEKTFGSVAETVKTIVENAISLDEGLHRVADAFSDSDEEFFNCTENLVVMEDFISGAPIRAEISSYLAICEPTENVEIEEFRRRLLATVEESYLNPNEILNEEMLILWETFHANFTEYYAQRHDSVMKSHQLQEKFNRIMNSPEWWEFENLSSVEIFSRTFHRQAREICRRFRQLNCREDVRQSLETFPFCSCPFNLSDLEEWEKMPQKLWEIVNHGLFSYRRSLLLMAETVAPLIEAFASKTVEPEFLAAADSLAGRLHRDVEFSPLGDREIFILQKVLKSQPNSLKIHLKLPPQNDFSERETMREKLNYWIDELPEKNILMRI